MSVDEGGDVESPALAAARSAGWQLDRGWTIRGGEVMLSLMLRKPGAVGVEGGTTPEGWVSYVQTYSGGEIEMLSAEIVRGHISAMAARAMQEHPPG